MDQKHRRPLTGDPVTYPGAVKLQKLVIPDGLGLPGRPPEGKRDPDKGHDNQQDN